MQVPRAPFHLDSKFLTKYHDTQPNWGPLGWVVYLRTYSLEKPNGFMEEFWETCQRVIEGVYQVQKGHCQNLNLPWNERKAQRSAQDMFERMYAFKWLPPGRGMSKMGTETMFRIGGNCLNNCGFVSTKDIGNPDVVNAFSNPFVWLMNMSMVGVGVGFDTEGAGTVSFVSRFNKEEIHVVGDSREGWCAYTRQLLESFVDPAVAFPIPDYSQVRPKGTPIQGFGGTASGPEALERMTAHFLRLWELYKGCAIDSRVIVDLFNAEGECVVSGGVRRTAEIGFGQPGDDVFLNLKNYAENPEANEWPRWASNNSFIVDEATDFTDMARLTAMNGEPGYFFLENAQAYGRMKDPPNYKDYRAKGANPCFVGSTHIATADGRGSVSLKQLAEEAKDIPVYSMDPETGEVSIKWGRCPRVTQTNAALVRVHLEDATHVDCTPNHRFYLKDGTWKEARDLQPRDSLSRFVKRQQPVKKGGNKYWLTHTNTRDLKRGRVYEHRLIAEFFDPETKTSLYSAAEKSGWIQGGLVVHHMDYNPLNNKPENLKWMTFKAHCKYHGEHDRLGESNGMWGKVHTDETKALIGAKTVERCQDPEYLGRLSTSHTSTERGALSTRMAEQKAKWDKKYYLAQEAQTDLATVWVGEQLFAKKSCEICESEFVVPWRKRARVHCTAVCTQTYLAALDKRKNNQRQYFTDKQQGTLHDQVMVYKDLDATGKVTKKLWEAECAFRNVPRRFQKPNAHNPHILTGFKHLQEVAATYNHRISHVEWLTHREDVYCITTDSNHTLVVIPEGIDTTKPSLIGLNVANCVEQTLENFELCCLVETFPSLHATYSDYEDTLKCAYLYAKTVTLVPTDTPETNAVMLRNRRIGCSQSGIQDSIEKIGLRPHLEWCDRGYAYIQVLDSLYSDWLCVPRSIKTTSVKPSGTVSKLVGVCEGIHGPKGEYELQTIRINDDSPVLPRLVDAGIRLEPAVKEPNTVIAYFPMKYNVSRHRDTTMWEQLELAALMQAYWADNQVSVTIDFDRETEGPEIQKALEMYASRLKGVSFLPRDDHGYVQAPKTVVSQEVYEAYLATLKPVDLVGLRHAHEVDDKFCSSAGCEIDMPE